MVRVLLAALVIVCVMSFAGIAEEGKKAADAAVASTGEKVGTIKHIDVGGADAGNQGRMYGVNEDRVMPEWESYNDNTGLPDRVPSDRRGEIE